MVGTEGMMLTLMIENSKSLFDALLVVYCSMLVQSAYFKAPASTSLQAEALVGAGYNFVTSRAHTH